MAFEGRKGTYEVAYDDVERKPARDRRNRLRPEGGVAHRAGKRTSAPVGAAPLVMHLVGPYLVLCCGTCSV